MSSISRKCRNLLCRANETLSGCILPKQNIKDEENLYFRIHPVFKKPGGAISSGAYNHTEMSTNLERLSSIKKTLKGYVGFGVVLLPVDPLRKDCLQNVIHKPVIFNYAHSLVIGKKSTPIKQKIKKLGQKTILVMPQDSDNQG
jgi:hypothetical protein